MKAAPSYGPHARPGGPGSWKAPTFNLWQVLLIIGLTVLLDSVVFRGSAWHQTGSSSITGEERSLVKELQGYILQAKGCASSANAAAANPAAANPAAANPEAANPAAAATTATTAVIATRTAVVAKGDKAVAATGAPLCTDSCFKAKDGVCDEGRGGNLTGNPAGENFVYCDLGTDCSDCGAWEGVANGPGWKEEVGPIEFLQRQQVEVRVTRTNVAPRMYFAYTNPDKDVDESLHMKQSKMIEGTITSAFFHVLRNKCDPAQPGSKGLVVDVGGNFGWFATFSAMLGCRVISFEPVPRFRAFFEYSSSLNGVSKQITIHPNVVAQDTNKEYAMMVPAIGQWGATRVGDQPGETSEIKVRAVRVDDVIGDQKVDLMKVDVEGFEPIVFSTAGNLLKKGLVDNIIFEYAPGYYHQKKDQLVALPSMLLTMLDAGFNLFHIPWGIVFINPHEPQGYGAPLPAMEVITRKHVQYDLWSSKLMGTTGLPGQHGPHSYPCPDLAKAGFTMPDFGSFWYTHPKGLHGAVVFNTNIWATKTPELVVKGPLLNHQLWPLDEPVSKKWFSDNKDWSNGFVLCKDHKPEYMVGLRCRCNDTAICGAHMKAVESCAEQGLLGYID